MSSIVGAAVLAAFVGQAAATPDFYDSVHSGCTIPDMAFGKHGAPEVSELVTMSLMSGAEEVTTFTPGEEYTIVVPGYSGPVNMWIHATDGIMMPETPGAQASACMEAAYGLPAAASHEFLWTAPDTADPVTISVAQAAGVTDTYKTNTMTIMGGGAAAAGAPAGAPGAAALPEEEVDEPGAATLPEEEVDEDPVADDAADTTTEEGDADAASSAMGVATGAFAAAVAAAAALAL